MNSVKSEDITTDTEDDIIAEKYRRMKERMGDDLDKMITEVKEEKNEYILQNIGKLEERDSLTKEELIRLKDLREINKEDFTREIIEDLYNAIFRETKEKDNKKETIITKKDKVEEKLPEILELEQNEELFQERYKRKKEKYDKIKEQIGDEIDEELLCYQHRFF